MSPRPRRRDSKPATLGIALTALDERSPERALSALLEVWRQTRNTRLAAAIEKLSAALVEGQPTPFDARKNPRQEWLTLAAKHTDATLPWLLSTLGHPRNDVTEERLRELLTWPADPRIATCALAMLQEVFGKDARRNGPHLLALLASTGDLRVLPALAPLGKEQRRLGRSIGPQARQVAAKLEKVVERALPDAELASLEAKVGGAVTAGATGNDSLEALFAAVYANPSSDEVRLVLADALQESGNPLGEFIALQVERARTGARPSRREEQLFKRWGAEWRERWGPHLHYGLSEDSRFERGFLVAARLRPDAAPVSEAWSTIRHLDVDPDEEWSDVLASPYFDHLHSVSAPTNWVLAALEARPRAWANVTVFGTGTALAALTKLQEQKRPLRALKRLAVSFEHDHQPTKKQLEGVFLPAWGALESRTLDGVVTLEGKRLRIDLFSATLELAPFLEAVPRGAFEAMRLDAAAELHAQGLWLHRAWFDPTPVVAFAKRHRSTLTFQRLDDVELKPIGPEVDLLQFRR
ncbi:MAG: TIGR02996 domain-containing protein [Myxococcaceae bacterium]